MMSHRIIPWENFSDIKKKNMIERMAWAKMRDYCGQIFTECSIFLCANRYCQYCFLCTMWTNLKQIYLHSIQVRYRYDLHVPSNSFSNCWQVVYFTGTKLFINLPSIIRSLNCDIKVWSAIKRTFIASLLIV